MAPHSSTLAWRIPGTGEPGGLPSMGSHRVGHISNNKALGIVLLPWGLVRLAGRAFWVWASLTHRPQVWDPFPSARLGTDSLRDTDTSTCTETQAPRDPGRHTQTRVHTPTLPHSPLLADLLSGLFPLSPHPPPQKSPAPAHSRQASTNTRKASLGSFKGKGQEQRWEAESSTTAAMEHQPSPSENLIPSLARGRQND